MFCRMLCILLYCIVFGKQLSNIINGKLFNKQKSRREARWIMASDVIEGVKRIVSAVLLVRLLEAEKIGKVSS